MSSRLEHVKKLRPPHYPQLEEALYLWWIRVRRNNGAANGIDGVNENGVAGAHNSTKGANNNISDAMVIEQAVKLAEKMGLPASFKVSKGWLHGFKLRRGISSKVSTSSSSPLSSAAMLALPAPSSIAQPAEHAELVDAHTPHANNVTNNHAPLEAVAIEAGGIESMDIAPVDDEIHQRRLRAMQSIELASVLDEKYTPDDTYSIGKTVLFYRAGPNDIRTVDDGETKQPARCTILFCVNASGTDKRPLLFVGRSKRGLIINNSNKISWDPSQMFSRWILAFNEDMTKAGRHAVVLMDFSPVYACDMASEIHIASFGGFELSNLTCLLLQPPTTLRTATSPSATSTPTSSSCSSIPLPMDNGLITTFKALYKGKLLARILRVYEAIQASGQRGGQAAASTSSSNNIQPASVSLPSVRDAVLWSREAWEDIPVNAVREAWRKAGVLPKTWVPNRPTKREQQVAAASPIQDATIRDLDFMMKRLPPLQIADVSMTIQQYVHADDDLPTEVQDTIQVKTEATTSQQADDADEQEPPQTSITDAVRFADGLDAFIAHNGTAFSAEEQLALRKLHSRLSHMYVLRPIVRPQQTSMRHFLTAQRDAAISR
eukprot:jgi/Chlat1/8902/Chrsp92S08234